MPGSVNVQPRNLLRYGVGILGASVLALGAALAAAPGAFAATYIITEDDVAPFENGDESSADYNYDEWHIGTTEFEGAEVSDAFIFGACSITATNPGGGWSNWPQMLLGYPIEERPTGEDAIIDIITGASLEVTEGAATLQFPIFVHIFDEDEQPVAGSPFFTTLRTDPPANGTVAYDDLVVSTGIILGGDGYLESFFDFVENEVVKDEEIQGSSFIIELLGVGFNASAPQNTEVASITFDGNTYKFGNECEDAGDVDGNGDGTGDGEADGNGDGTDGGADGSPTPPDKVDTSFGSDSLAITLMVSGIAIAAAALAIRRKTLQQ